MSAKKIKKWFGMGIIFLFILIFVVAIFANKNEIRQPIAFNHKKHVDNNVPCSFCHRHYKDTYYAGIPQTNVCITCHEDVIYVTPEKKKIEQYYQQKQPIPWKQIYKGPDYAFFSHRLHVKVGKIDCQKCHGEVQKMTQPFTRQPIPLKMKYCIQCHEKVQKISNPYECIDCHR